MYKDLIDQKDALFLIDYNELTGDCFWKARSLDYVVANKVRTKEQELKRINDLIAGTKIGSYSQDAIFNGLRIRILGRTYKLSRVIWLYMTGEWPNGEIDHKDGNPLNNAWNNLRCVSHAQNMRNLKANVKNKSGFKGVYWCKKAKRFRAQISINGKMKYIGLYDTAEDASLAYKEKAKSLGFSNRHIDGNPYNNDPANLVVVDVEENGR